MPNLHSFNPKFPHHPLPTLNKTPNPSHKTPQKPLKLLSKPKIPDPSWNSFEHQQKIDQDLQEYDRINLTKDIEQIGIFSLIFRKY